MSSISLYHETIYEYDKTVFLSTHLFRLRPAAHAHAEVVSYQLTVTPSSHHLHWLQDAFGNFIARVDFTEPMQRMSIGIKLLAKLQPFNPFDFFIDSYAQSFPFYYSVELRNDLAPYFEIVDRGPKLLQLASKAAESSGSTINFLVFTNNLVFQEIGYTLRMEPGVQRSEESLEKATGSCRDFSWLLVQLFRHLGIASRFVSGYLVQFKDAHSPGTVDLHAWTEVYIPGAGWIGLDPTSGLLAGEGHIPLACTPRLADAAPVIGTTDACQSSISFKSTVVRF